MRTPTDIVRHVSSELGVELERVCSAETTPTALRARRIVVYVLRSERGLSYGEIAKTLKAKRESVWWLYRREAAKPDAEIARFLGGDA